MLELGTPFGPPALWLRRCPRDWDQLVLTPQLRRAINDYSHRRRSEPVAQFVHYQVQGLLDFPLFQR